MRVSKRAAEIAREQTLPPGRYLAKIYVDQRGRLQKDFRTEVRSDDLVGQIELRSRWPAGYGRMTVAKSPRSGRASPAAHAHPA